LIGVAIVKLPLAGSADSFTVLQAERLFVASSLTSLAVVNFVAIELFEVEMLVAWGELVPLWILGGAAHPYVCVSRVPTKKVETQKLSRASYVAALDDRAITGAEALGLNLKSPDDRYQIRAHCVSPFRVCSTMPPHSGSDHYFELPNYKVSEPFSSRIPGERYPSSYSIFHRLNIGNVRATLVCY
jgi:hypothetical protein